MSYFFFVKHDVYCLFLLQINSFQFRWIHTRQYNDFIIQIGMNVREIYTFERIFIEKLACTIEWTNIFRYLIINGSYMVNPRYLFASITPRKFIEDFLSILLFPIIKTGGFNGISSLKKFFWMMQTFFKFFLKETLTFFLKFS